MKAKDLIEELKKQDPDIPLERKTLIDIFECDSEIKFLSEFRGNLYFNCGIGHKGNLQIPINTTLRNAIKRLIELNHERGYWEGFDAGEDSVDCY